MKFLKNEELNRPAMADFIHQQKMRVTVVLDNVRSGMNIGSVFRTADSFLVERILLCGISACPPDREILKTALGATESVSWQYFKTTADALEELKRENYLIYAVEQCAESITPQQCGYNQDFPTALVFGHEVKGVDPELTGYFHKCIEIPQSGTKHSLNVSVCAGIVLWEFYKKYTSEV
jgi:23S rRNA (guanosine2251-2'-O)-methyltransferase